MPNLDPQLVAQLPPDVARLIVRTVSRAHTEAWRDSTASLEAAMPRLIQRWVDVPPVRPTEYVILGWPPGETRLNRPAVAVARHPNVRPSPGAPQEVYTVFYLGGNTPGRSPRWGAHLNGGSYSYGGPALKAAAKLLLRRDTRRRRVTIGHATRSRAGPHRYRFTVRMDTRKELVAAARAFAGW